MTVPANPHGWTCPSCRRHVPARIATCRCGAARSSDEVEDEGLPPEGRRRGFPLWEVLALLAAVAAVPLAIRHFREPPPAISAPRLSLLETLVSPASSGSSLAAAPAAPPVPATPVPTPGVNRHPWGLEIPAPELVPPPDHPVGRARGRRASGTSRAEPTPEPSVRSAADVARARGRQELRDALSLVASRGRTLLNLVQSYESTCGDSRPGPPGCERLLDQIGTVAIAVGRALDEAEDIARRSWLQPGDVRDMRKQMGLDDRLWDEIANIARQYGR